MSLVLSHVSNAEQTYKMYLDDGISRESAPKAPVPELKIGDSKAAGKYCEVTIEQVSHIVSLLLGHETNATQRRLIFPTKTPPSSSSVQ